ncbi:acyltransferase [Helicobacter cetorum]|uniref:acyltransferase n=1 Tax=Helicobacter cetorum TaxID=138563 RepID=UPI000CF1086E|nr:acyltransferase [Helicobacter cetorum]
MSVFIHSSSFIDEGAIVLEGSKIWHFCHILTNTRIGKNCTIGQNCMLGPDVSIGNNCKIQNNVSVYSGVTCEDDVFIGPSVVFTNVKRPRSFINQKHCFSKTLLKEGCTIGANATIVCGISIGRYAFVGAGSVVNKDVLDFEMVVGVPAQFAGWVSKNGNMLIFDAQNIAKDKSDNSTYHLNNGIVKEITNF